MKIYAVEEIGPRNSKDTKFGCITYIGFIEPDILIFLVGQTQHIVNAEPLGIMTRTNPSSRCCF